MPKKNAKQKKSRGKKAPGRQQARISVPAWLAAVRDPDRHPPTSVPDEDCSPSCKTESRALLTVTTSDATGTAADHGILVGVAPFMGSNSGNGLGSIGIRGYNSAVGYVGNVTIEEVPNKSAICPLVTIGSATTVADYMVRCTAIKAKFTYLGTELNRAGKIVAGLADISAIGTSVAASKNPLSAVFDGLPYNLLPNQATTSVRNRLRRLTQLRNPDGSVEITWIPTGAPKYVAYNDNGQTTADLAPAGPCIIFMVNGDQTAAAGTSGNNYGLEVVWHWEIKPFSRLALAIAPTPSPYDPAALATCLNAFQQMSAVSEDVGAGVISLQDGAQGSPGSAWESFRRGAGSVVNSAMDGLTRPEVQQILYNTAQTMMRSRLNPAQRRLMY